MDDRSSWASMSAPLGGGGGGGVGGVEGGEEAGGRGNLTGSVMRKTRAHYALLTCIYVCI